MFSNVLSRSFLNRLTIVESQFKMLGLVKHQSDLTRPPIESIQATQSRTPAKQLIFNRQLPYIHNINLKVTVPRQCWVDNFESDIIEKRGLIELHPRVFAAFPRPDIIECNIHWQKKYRQVDWVNMKTRQEMPGRNKKPWPQKGTGRARHGSKRSCQWHNGGWMHGPRGPRTYFYMLNYFVRVRGLISVLSAKFSQNDIKFVDTLENFPSDDPEYLKSFLKERDWGSSCLIVDSNEIFPRNIALAADKVDYINLMPVYGLNCFSMLKHETLVLTVAAVEELEEKLLYQFERTDIKNVVENHSNRKPGSES